MILLKKPKKSKRSSTITKLIGNITGDTDIAFEFGSIAIKDKECESIVKSLKNSVLIQAQITFKRTNGSTCLRVITKERELTTKRDEVLVTIDVALTALSGVQQCAKIAKTGKFKDARDKLVGIQKLLSKAAKTDQQIEEYYNFLDKSDPLDKELKANENNTRAILKDQTAKILYQMKNANRVLFLSGARKNLNKRDVEEGLKEVVQKFGVEQTY